MDMREVAVVGLGTVGAGIAEVLAAAGLSVVAIEVDPSAPPLLAQHAVAGLAVRG